MRNTSSLGLAAALGLAALMPLGAAAQQQDFSKVEIKVEHVAGKVYMLTGSGGNIGVSVGEDGLLIVDDQYAPLADKIRAALKGLGEGKLKFVLNTHWHGDHTGGNESFGAEAPILAQTNVRKRMAVEQHVMGETVPASPAKALPVVTYDQSIAIHFNGEDLDVVHYPHGHTDGDSVIFFTGSNVVHMGDDFFNGMFPFVDLASGGSVQGLTENVAQILKKLPAGVKVIPGHGPLSDAAGLTAFHHMLVATTAVVQKEMKAGKSLEDIKKAGLPTEWDSWGKGFIKTPQWLEFVYNSLKGGSPKPAADTKHH
ncbi:MAG TPA: MBL fold metallo-hydrolase [Thermoanaerobaculia bacterium]|jgi:glyoxylase-like metal-dependent hydrolase (beta-lactamase superfamily II)|nr:MBL fold metallo-hydrolase [Thermoanaerobaculia bacterium]